MTDPIRALMAQMAAELDHNRRCLMDDATLTHPLADRARAALAEPVAEPPAPPAEGEVAELVHELHHFIAGYQQMRGLDPEYIYSIHRGDPMEANLRISRLKRAAELLERHAAMENLAADAVSALRYIEQTAGRLYGVGWDRVFDAAATLQPAHAMPLPAPQDGEVEP